METAHRRAIHHASRFCATERLTKCIEARVRSSKGIRKWHECVSASTTVALGTPRDAARSDSTQRETRALACFTIVLASRRASCACAGQEAGGSRVPI